MGRRSDFAFIVCETLNWVAVKAVVKQGRLLPTCFTNLIIGTVNLGMANPSFKDCIAKNIKSCTFKVSPSQTADGSEPFFELSAFSEVARHAANIDKVSRELNVDADLIRSIMYMETTHGYYDAPLSLFGANKSILPMNVNVAYWGDAFGTRKNLQKPYENIRAEGMILQRIVSNLPVGASVSQIATLYNNINASTVSDYGARVQRIYETKPWLKMENVDNNPLTGQGGTVRNRRY